MNNSDVIVRALEQAGVRWVFGVPSGPVLPLIDALRRSSIDFILTASETSAGFMATAVGYLTGVPGACVSTVGPGATNLTTGVGCAWLDRAPVIAITCNVAIGLARPAHSNAHRSSRFVQAFDQGDAFLSRLFDPSKRSGAPLAVATEEPPGPVHLDLPEDIAQANAGAVAEWRHEPSRQTDLVAGHHENALSGSGAGAPPVGDHGI